MEEALDFARVAGPLENDYIAEWKGEGRPVVGFFCAHAPEELLWAAGILPVRMRGTGSDETSDADQYLGAFNCGFVRHTLDRVMKGDLSFLDGLLVLNSCDHIRRLSEIFKAKKLAPFCYYLDVPHVNSEEALGRLIEHLRSLGKEIESFFGVTISREKLADAVKLYNRTRALLSRASALRAEDPPRIRGSETLAMAVASASMPKDRFNLLLERRLEELERGSPETPNGGPRLLVIGGTLDEPGYLETIESLGATIVADQLCWGSKAFSHAADETIDPIEAIARRMLERMPCPRMLNDYPTRLANLREAVEEYRVDGVICERLKFCDLWGGETEMLRRSLKEEPRIPLLVLERDYLAGSGVGQLRTRVQAFLETLG